VSLLAEGILEAVREFLTNLFSEPTLISSATYHSREGSTTELNRSKPHFTDTPITVIVTDDSYTSVVKEKLPFVGAAVDVLFLAEGAPGNITSRDKITVDGKLRGIKSVNPYFGIAYGLVTEGED
jgi:hypothetical protein